MSAILIDIEAMERRALEAAVAEARADLRPGVPHEQVRAEMLKQIDQLWQKSWVLNENYTHGAQQR